jgi:hypothetical protein
MKPGVLEVIATFVEALKGEYGYVSFTIDDLLSWANEYKPELEYFNSKHRVGQLIKFNLTYLGLMGSSKDGYSIIKKE